MGWTQKGCIRVTLGQGSSGHEWCSNIISTRNIFVHPWGKYPTLIKPTCSNCTCRAYVPINFQKGFNQRCDHERLCLKWVEQKRVAFEKHLVRVRQHMSDDVTMNYFFPSLNDALGMGSPANSPRFSLPNEIEFCDNWVYVGGSTLWMTNSFSKVRYSDWFFQSLSVFDWHFSFCRILKGNFARIALIRNRF